MRQFLEHSIGGKKQKMLLHRRKGDCTSGELAWEDRRDCCGGFGGPLGTGRWQEEVLKCSVVQVRAQRCSAVHVGYLEVLGALDESEGLTGAESGADRWSCEHRMNMRVWQDVL